jgi:hypothetical protein
MNYKQITIALLAITFASCQKKEHEETTNVNITISTPTEGQQFKSGDTVQISASGTANGELHGYETKITDTATGAVLFDDAHHAHTNKFTVSEKWAGIVTTAKVMKVSITAVVDHNGTQAKKEVYFKMEP